MNRGDIMEPVTVGAVFQTPGNVRPAWFIWNGRKIRVIRTNHSWTERQGIATLRHFSVSDGTDVYHLVMNSDTQVWHLEGVQLPV